MVTWRYYACDHTERAGIHLDYGDGCHGAVLICPGHERAPWRATWDAEDRLTLDPSIRSRQAGSEGHEHHGYIRDGEWQDA